MLSQMLKHLKFRSHSYAPISLLKWLLHHQFTCDAAHPKRNVKKENKQKKASKRRKGYIALAKANSFRMHNQSQ
jgi:hypothetical protein